MVDHRLAPRSALAGQTGPLSVAGRVLSEVAGLAMVSVAARSNEDAAVADRLAVLTGAPVPEPGRCIGDASLRILWAGPGQWLVIARASEWPGLAAMLRDSTDGKASIVPQDDGWTCMAMEGHDLDNVLERLTPLDTRAMAAGHASRTPIHHVGVFLLCIEPGRCVHILAPRSYAQSVHHALADALRASAALESMGT